MREISDRDLVAKCLNGDNKAFDQLVLRYQLPMYRTALQIVQDESLARDITQNGFIKSWEKLHTYNSKYRFYSWLYKIIINESLNKKRSVRKMDSLTTAEKSDETPYAQMVKNEEKEKLYKAISLLTEEQKIVIHLRHFEELSYKEMSDVLDIEEKTVKSRLYSARMKLREILQPK
jgi:RNA polymerase sigma-70 factor, ECF subfamily